MCASYMIMGRSSGEWPISAEVRVDLHDFADQLIVPHRPAPVYVRAPNQNHNWLTPMQFSMLACWLEEAKVKFASHNARRESIDSKPIWKWVFFRRHCVVSLTSIIEPIYKGEHARFMLAFSQAKEELLLAAGVWDEWVNPSTGEVIASFAIITSDLLPFVAEIGHDRSPVFLNAANSETWLENMGQPAETLKSFLTDSAATPALQVQRHRPMRPGWEKRKNI